MNIRVLTYNIHKGVQYYSRSYILDRIKTAITRLEVDFVFLQEVMGTHPPGNHRADFLESQFEYLADTVWHHYAYGQNAVYSRGHHGNAILSQFPIKKWTNINISTSTFERRGLLHVIVDIPRLSKEIHLICLHLDLFERGRSQQFRQMSQYIQENIPAQAPLILGGDFNDWRRRASRELQKPVGLSEVFKVQTGQYAKTFPSWLPFLSLDRIYTRGFQPISCKVLRGEPWNRLSDHAALTAELSLK